MRVTVFGGTYPKPDTLPYEEAVKLGRLLAQAGHVVISGGYMGVMEAVSQGAALAGGHVIGVTCDEIERWRNVPKNRWVKEEWRRATLPERMITLMDEADAIIVMPGGIGTLAETALIWNRMLIQATTPKKVILVGEGWRKAITALYEAFPEYYPNGHQEMVLFASTVEDAVKLLAS